jgi:hypothetical protein
VCCPIWDRSKECDRHAARLEALVNKSICDFDGSDELDGRIPAAKTDQTTGEPKHQNRSLSDGPKDSQRC